MIADQSLEARGLRSGYHGIEVVHGVDLTVAPGEIVALFGPNGAGKTTVLLTLAGVLPAVSGNITWRGEPLTMPAHQRSRQGLRMVAEHSVFQQLNVEGNLRLGPGPVSEALAIFPELRPLLRRRAGLLSGGEQQMLTLARALCAGPLVLLADEMSLGLAPIAVTRLLEATRRAADAGVGILLVEQQVERALAVADRGYVMDRGLITFKGSRAELRTHLNEGALVRDLPNP